MRLPTQERVPAPAFQLHGPVPSPDPNDVVEPRPPTGDEWRRRFSAWLSNRLQKKDLDHYDVRRFWFPSVAENGQSRSRLAVRYYRSQLPGRRPVAIILPIYGSYRYPAEKVAWRLRHESRGKLHIMMILSGERNVNWEAIASAKDLQALDAAASGSAEKLRAAVVDTRRLIQWVAYQPNADPEHIAMIGFSIGAVIGGAVITNEPYISHSVLIMGAARPGQILATCPGKAADARHAVMERFGWDREQYAAYMGHKFQILDPARYADRVDPRQVLIFEASEDDCMPPCARQAFWEALGRPGRYLLNGTHKRAFLTMTPLKFDFTTDRIWEFLETRLFDSTLNTAAVNE